MQQDTLVIMTGGTIDAEAYPNPKKPPDRAIMLEKSLIPETMLGMTSGKRCDFLDWNPKDSNDYTDAEIQELAKIIRTSKAQNIIITHGTDMMPKHSRMIKKLLEAPDAGLRMDANEAGKERFIQGETPVLDKRVIFTGAMMPLANGPKSDGHKNLEHIMAHMDDWNVGVRVVMHAHSYAPEGLFKDKTTYSFKGQRLADDRSPNQTSALR